MKTVKAVLKSASPYGQSRYHGTPMLDKESHEDYEKRTWKNKLHTDKKGNIFIPPMAVKNCLLEAAAYSGKKIQGKGQKTWTKKFEAGILVVKEFYIGKTVNEVEECKVFVPSDGKRGGGKRVFKSFPVVPEWCAEIEVLIVDPIITEKIFREHLEEAGKYIGLGYFRPSRNGYYGRFTVEEMKFDI
jgi:hypothetical protein